MECPLTVGAIDRKHITMKNPKKSVTITTTRAYFPWCCYPWSMQNADSCGWTVGQVVLAQMHRFLTYAF